MPDVKFGVNQISNPSPLWAKWIFRGTLLLTSVATFIIASDPGIPDALKVRIGVYLKALDLLMYGLSKMVGIQIADDDKPSDKP